MPSVWPLFKKIIRVMKLTTVFILFAFLQVSAKGYGQVTIKEKDASLEKVISLLKKQTGYLFIYDKEQLKPGLVSVDVRNVPLESALEACFRNQPITYKIVDRNVILQPKALNQVDRTNLNFFTIDVRGTVTDSIGSPLSGANVMVKGSSIKVITDNDGKFFLANIPNGSTLIVSFIGYTTEEIKAADNLKIVLKQAASKLEEVTINTGYQSLRPNEMTGSVAQIGNDLFNRRVSTDVLSRIDGIASGVFFNKANVGSTFGTQLQGGTGPTQLGINIRGQSTLQTGYVSADPLIVMDNFIYEGNINNINPNDVETITVLKDAASASIWGAKSGNGVIVITTKRGKLNQKTKVDFNANLTMGPRPNLKYDRSFLDASNYLEAEQFINTKGLLNGIINNNINSVPISPFFEIVASRRKGQITSADSASRVNALKSLDVRNDFDKYVYQKSIAQQYSVNLNGGSNTVAYRLSVGADKTRDNLIKNGTSRYVIKSLNTFNPVKNLEITAGINITHTDINQSNQFGYKSAANAVGGAVYGTLYPYAQLADNNGIPVAIVKDYRYAWVDTIQRRGYLDWKYRPLDEINLANSTIKATDYLIQGSAKYRFSSFITGQMGFQNERQIIEGRNLRDAQSYYMRNMINKFSVRASNGTFNYNFPIGSELDASQSALVSKQFRGQVDYDRTFKDKHRVVAIAGGEVRDNQLTGSSYSLFGYNDDTGTSVSNLDFSKFYPTFPAGASTFPSPTKGVSGTHERFISYYASGFYSYLQRYSFSISGRRDGANLFGVKTNDKFTPFWSIGGKWDIDQEPFYKLSWLPSLKLRASYGFNGNVYTGGAYLTGLYSTDQTTGLPVVTITRPPNPELRWEKIKNLNLGIDFSLKNNVISGTVEYFVKNGVDLIEQGPLAPSTGYTSFTGNAASTRTKGIDLSLNTKNLNGNFKWFTSLLLSTLNDKVIHYDQQYLDNSLVANFGGIATEGKPLYSIFSYKWAGLDPANGDPRGYLNGKVSKDYATIINNAAADSLKFNGSARPTVYGAIRNTIALKNFSLSVNVSYSFGYYFRRQSTSLNYRGVLLSPNIDYTSRWQKPGDEANTNVPSLVYPNNDNRSDFYKYSEVLVEKGDHIRLQDVQLTYDVTKKLWEKMPFDNLSIYAYANNLGILWRANKYKIDPDYPYSAFTPVRTISFGIKTRF